MLSLVAIESLPLVQAPDIPGAWVLQMTSNVLGHDASLIVQGRLLFYKFQKPDAIKYLVLLQDPSR